MSQNWPVFSSAAAISDRHNCISNFIAPLSRKTADFAEQASRAEWQRQYGHWDGKCSQRKGEKAANSPGGGGRPGVILVAFNKTEGQHKKENREAARSCCFFCMNT
ncbi:hypothetical protein [Burkholderia glumae]|uniref:hypothetical protein n=1 Tax=Burkholderia glumae TaxID=337 RepID=UPI0021512565|nr:hypothetical protein [Burkholderia glumae]